MLRKLKPNFFVTFVLTRLLVAIVVAWVYGVSTAGKKTHVTEGYVLKQVHR